MIYSRSPEQYDPAPFLDPRGNRYGAAESPREAKWIPRLFLAPAVDIEPVMDTGYKRYSIEAVENLLVKNPEAIATLTWSPRTGESHRHNQILSSIRNVGNRPIGPELYRLWLTTLEEFHPETLIALSPGLNGKKILEAKEILSRLLRVHEEVL